MVDKREQARSLIAQAIHPNTARPLALETALQACRIIAKHDLLGAPTPEPNRAPRPAPAPARAARPPPAPRPPPPPPIDPGDWFPGEREWRHRERGYFGGDIPPPATAPPDFQKLRNGKVIAAKHAGTCRWCGVRFERGVAIFWDPAMGPDHADCATERDLIHGMNGGAPF